jgi:BASS family bile acid:Na+ symporter
MFFILFVTFCKVDFHKLRPVAWHLWVGVFQLLFVLTVMALILVYELTGSNLILMEALLTVVVAPCAAAAPVVTQKLGGNLEQMTTYTLLSALASALLIPLAFPMLEQTVHVSFLSAFAIILRQLALVLLLPLVLGWVLQRHVPSVSRWVASVPDLSFYLWAFTLSITTGITVRNIVHSQASAWLLAMIATMSLVLCVVQFGLGRAIGRWLGEEVNSGQALFQKNTALAIWVSYMYLHPVASVGAGCYVLWQNMVNSLELWHYRRNQRHDIG